MQMFYGEDLYVEIEDPVLTAWHLPTPFGNLFVEVNSSRSGFQVEYLPLVGYSYKDPNWVLFDVAARFKIIPYLDAEIEYPVILNCYLDVKETLDYQSPETGEHMAALGLGTDGFRLCLAAYDDDEPWYSPGGERIEPNQGLNCIELGAYNIKMLLAEKKRLPKAFFCVAWKSLNQDGNNSESDDYQGVEDKDQPNFAVDPYLIPGCIT